MLMANLLLRHPLATCTLPEPLRMVRCDRPGDQLCQQFFASFPLRLRHGDGGDALGEGESFSFTFLALWPFGMGVLCAHDFNRC